MSGYTLLRATTIAKAEIGYRESGTNVTKFNDWLGVIPGYPHGGRGYPWCMSFQSWVAWKAGGAVNIDFPKTAGCATAVGWFKRKGRWSSTPHVGDMVFYGPGGGTHVELVVAVTSSTITTVGGNTSGTLNGRYHEGDGVYMKKVARGSARIYGYGRPDYAPPKPGEEPPLVVPDGNPVLRHGSPYEAAVRQLQKCLNHAGMSPNPGLEVDGDFGDKTETAVKRFQRMVGLNDDGEYGPKTAAKLRARVD